MFKILVVDDVQEITYLTKVILEKDGHSVAEAHDVDRAYRLLKKDCFDLVILDVMLPKMNGIKLLRYFQKNLQAIPDICFLSGMKKKDVILKSYEYGGKGFITKPIDPLILRDQVQTILSGNRESMLLEKNVSIRLNISELPVENNFECKKISERGIVVHSPFKMIKGTTFTGSLSPAILSDEEDELIFWVRESVCEESRYVSYVDFVCLDEIKRQRLRSFVISV